MTLVGLVILAYLCYETYKPLVIVVADDTPPVINAIMPTDGVTLEGLPEVSAEIYDVESYIDGHDPPKIFLDDDYEYILTAKGDDIWACHSIWAGHKTGGTHSFKFWAKNRNGLITEVSGFYYIYENLAGVWYINDIEITSPTQTVRLTTRTLSFGFIKTSGLDTVTCTVDWTDVSNPEQSSMTLDRTVDLDGDGTLDWFGTHTFVGGTYKIDLVADDGLHSITMTIWGLNVGTQPLRYDVIGWVVGFGLLAGGLLLIRQNKKS